MSYQIGDLQFNATVYDTDGNLHTFNIFGSPRVKEAICRYKISMSINKNVPVAADLCMYFFGDYWSRCEYEMVLESWPERAPQRKIDVYKLFIEPNFPMLLEMINHTTVSSCRQWRKVNGR